LGPAVARALLAAPTSLTPRWSNCSGNHAAMLALSRLHGWPTEGYAGAGHPVQARIARVITEWTEVHGEHLLTAVDGCTTVCFGLPLRNMARAYARLAASDAPAPTRVRQAMLRHPELVAGEGRCCTDCMRAIPGVIVKVGAEGVYCAALLAAGVGVALKVHDGDARAAPLALVAILRRLAEQLSGAPAVPATGLEAWDEAPIFNTRGTATGVIRAEGRLRFSGPAG